MKINISTKQISKRGNQVASCPYELHTIPKTLRQLISIFVADSVEGYNRRLNIKDPATILSSEAIDAMSHVGKIGFGIPFGNQPADVQDSLETAFQGFEDGLFRLFIGEEEVEFLDTPLQLREDDTITIVRLVMLTGGYFR